MNNLLLNTIKHSPKNSKINVLLNTKCLEISNFGEQFLEKNQLFKRFGSVSEYAAGSGLGLAIIKQICEVHFWEIKYSFQNNSHHFKINF